MQKEKWITEYAIRKDLPSSRTDKPSRALITFIETHPDFKGQALDVGCGNGRNLIYLAQNGFSVAGIEIVPEMVEVANQKLINNLYAKGSVVIDHSAGEKLPYKDQTFDLIIDMMTKHSLNPSEREVYAKEVNRMLNIGGYFVFYTISLSSPAAQVLFKVHPGPEPNSYIIPQSQIIEKTFSQDDLSQLFSPLKWEHFEEKIEFTPAFGDMYERTYIYGVMKKVKELSFR